MDGGDSLSESSIKMSNKDLAETIERMKRNLGMLPLPDGGKKLKFSLNRFEEELKRRLKVDEKGKKQPQFGDLCLSGSSETPSSSLANHGSEFSKKLEKLVINKEDDAFKTELSILNGCNQKKMISSGSHLSNSDQKRMCSTSTPVTTKSAKRRKANQGKDSSCNDFVDLDEEDECEILETKEQVNQEESLNGTRIYYPNRDDPESVEILYTDLECLAPEEYVTSSIMNFYIRYLQLHKDSTSKQANECYFFNTYFYEKLKEAMSNKNDDETIFAKIRRWWKGVNLFEKSYIFLPIHEQKHWSLVIICIPDKEAVRGPILLHLDSLDYHPTKLIFANIRRLLIGEWNYLKKEESYMNMNMDFYLPKKIWNNLPRRIDVKKCEVPQQSNDYDCGLFVLYYIQRFIETAPQRVKKDLPMLGSQWFKPSEASNLRDLIRKLLKEEFNKAEGNICLKDA